MPGTHLALNGEAYKVVSDEMLPSGRRALTRSFRPSEPSDPGRIVTRRWKLSGPIGRSREGGDGVLGHEYSIDLETRFDSLLTSGGARTALSMQDAASSSPQLGAFALGSAPLGVSGVGDVAHIIEDRRFLFVGRGRGVTQINSSMAAVQTTFFDAQVRGMAVEGGKHFVGVGPTQTVREADSVSATTTTYSEALANTYADSLLEGSDRLWMVRREPSSGSGDHEARFTNDAFSAVSNSFRVGDDSLSVNGIGRLGPHTFFGADNGIYGFTIQGKPVEMLSLRENKSSNNGKSWADLWGWAYVTTEVGVYAIRPGVTNPVGVGSDKMLDFEGPTGRPLAVGKYRDSLFVYYHDDDDDRGYIWRGVFSPGKTPGTGDLDWYPFRRLAAGIECHAFGGYGQRTNPTLVWGEDENAGWQTMGRQSREIDDSNYTFSTSGGQWFGTSTKGSILRNLRHASFITENCDGSNTWQLANAVDGGSYVDVGAAVSTNGRQMVRPVSGTTPLTTVNGYAFKPRLTQVAASSSSPPQIRGDLDMTFDERPDMIEEITVMVQIETEDDFDRLAALVTNTTASPDKATLPNELDEIDVMVAGLSERQDIKGNGVEAIAVTLHKWDVS